MRIRRLVLAAIAAVTTTAVARELRQPAERREWHGRVAGVPYDFRRPTAARLRQACWNPEGGLLSPRAFGVGWDVNLWRLARRFRRA